MEGVQCGLVHGCSKSEAQDIARAALETDRTFDQQPSKNEPYHISCNRARELGTVCGNGAFVGLQIIGLPDCRIIRELFITVFLAVNSDALGLRSWLW